LSGQLLTWVELHDPTQGDELRRRLAQVTGDDLKVSAALGALGFGRLEVGGRVVRSGADLIPLAREHLAQIERYFDVGMLAAIATAKQADELAALARKVHACKEQSAPAEQLMYLDRAALAVQVLGGTCDRWRVVRSDFGAQPDDRNLNLTLSLEVLRGDVPIHVTMERQGSKALSLISEKGQLDFPLVFSFFGFASTYGGQTKVVEIVDAVNGHKGVEVTFQRVLAGRSVAIHAVSALGAALGAATLATIVGIAAALSQKPRQVVEGTAFLDFGIWAACAGSLWGLIHIWRRHG
jgi:hypothetical protein